MALVAISPFSFLPSPGGGIPLLLGREKRRELNTERGQRGRGPLQRCSPQKEKKETKISPQQQPQALLIPIITTRPFIMKVRVVARDALLNSFAMTPSSSPIVRGMQTLRLVSAAPPSHIQQMHPRSSILCLAATSMSDLETISQVASLPHPIFNIATLNATTAGTIASILKPTLSVASLLMIIRIVMTWYPELDVKKLPWSVAYAPTEPLLSITRKIVKPFNGLDVSPIVWVAMLTLFSELLTGPQGILTMMERKGM